MIGVEKFFIMLSHLFTDPLCDVTVPWELPVPYWTMALILLYSIGRGSIASTNEFFWIIMQLIIASRIELLLIALILPFIIGKQATWCKTPEYIWGVVVFFIRVAYITSQIAVQLQNVSPQCIGRLEAVTNAKKYRFD